MPNFTKTEKYHDELAAIKAFVIKNAKQPVPEDDITSITRLSTRAIELLAKAIENVPSR